MMNTMWKYSDILSKDTLFEIVRFGIVGVTATLIHYGIYCLLKLWIEFNLAYTIGYAISFVCNFYLTTYFTFKKKATLKKGFKFGGVHLFNYLFQMLLLNFVVWLGIDKSLAPIPVYLIVIPVQFLLVRHAVKRP